MAAQTLDDLPTPALILDRAILRRNLKRMSERLRSAGVMLRPHLKTAKSIEVGRMAVEGHDGRITVSTLAEARYFADGGFKDILYGVGVVPSKLAAVAELRRRGVNLRVVTDNLVVARAIADAAKNGDTFSVFIEIDSGGGRAGLPWPELPGLLQIARILHGTPGVELAGVMTHAGHSYHESTPEGIAAVAEQERQAIVSAAEKLRAAGIPCPIVSGGSTPTAIATRCWSMPARWRSPRTSAPRNSSRRSATAPSSMRRPRTWPWSPARRSTAAAYDRYYVVDSELDGGKSVVDIYDRINGW